MNETLRLVKPEYRRITPEQLKQGWIELRGVTPIHHNYIVVSEEADGTYIVKEPDR